MQKNRLLLGSKSASRKQLLEEAKIPFVIVGQDADEVSCDWSKPLDELVQLLARFKMAHVVLPDGNEGDFCYVLTADTLSQDADGTIEGKPVDRADARRKIQKARDGSRLCTGFCLEKKELAGGFWKTVQRKEAIVEARYLFYVPDELIEYYLDNSVGLVASNAIAVEGFGGQFLKSVSGSYTTIVGLPMFEVREALQELGFFDAK